MNADTYHTVPTLDKVRLSHIKLCYAVRRPGNTFTLSRNLSSNVLHDRLGPHVCLRVWAHQADDGELRWLADLSQVTIEVP